MAIELVFETHSTTVDNEQGHATGWLPGQLSEQGRTQAQQLGRRRTGDQITAVFSSDLARAAQTASIAFAGRRSRCCMTGGCANATTGSATGCPWPSCTPAVASIWTGGMLADHGDSRGLDLGCAVEVRSAECHRSRDGDGPEPLGISEMSLAEIQVPAYLDT